MLGAGWTEGVDAGVWYLFMQMQSDDQNGFRPVLRD